MDYSKVLDRGLSRVDCRVNYKVNCRGVECTGMDCRRMDCKVMDCRGDCRVDYRG